MNRQIVINGIVGGVMGNASWMAYTWGHPIYALLIFGGWMVGMINSLIPRQPANDPSSATGADDAGRVGKPKSSTKEKI